MSPERGCDPGTAIASLFVRCEGAMSGNDSSQALSLGVGKTL